MFVYCNQKVLRTSSHQLWKRIKPIEVITSSGKVISYTHQILTLYELKRDILISKKYIFLKPGFLSKSFQKSISNDAIWADFIVLRSGTKEMECLIAFFSLVLTTDNLIFLNRWMNSRNCLAWKCDFLH